MEMPGRRVALVIGIDRYQRPIPPLSNAVADATAVGDVLRTLHGYEVHSVCDEAATLDGLRRQLGEVAETLGPDDRLLLYFAGHGVAHEAMDGAEGPQGSFIPQDARRDDRDSFWSMADVHLTLKKLRCRHLLMVLDCCFAGAFRWSNTRDVAVRPRRIYRERYERYLREPAWQVITSAAHDETALDVVAGAVIGARGSDGRNSPFAQALVAGLHGQADLPIAGEADGVIVASELHLFVEEAMARLEKRLGRPQQRPLLWSLGTRTKGEYLFHTPGKSPKLPSALELNEKNNPYRGLEPYEQANKDLYFGREALIAQLCEQVSAQPLTVVVGASGTGKSSLVKAGLLPRLPGFRGARWHILQPMRPGNSPLQALAGLGRELAAGWAQGDGETELLLVIDQMEELITMGAGPTEQDAFLVQLRAALLVSPRVHAVLTLRSDFEPHFAGALSRYSGPDWRFHVPPMTRAELREAITGPAAERVLSFEPPELVEKLIDEVADTPGALPLLSFTLSEMYRAYLRRSASDRALTEADYRALGEVAGALGQRADQLYEQLPEAHRTTLSRVMLRMVALEGGEAARRRVPLSELKQADDEEDKRVAEVLRRLVDARLVVEGQDGEGQAYAEPAHDKLVLGWRRLWELIRAAREDLPLLRRLTQAAAEWERDRRPAWRLWPDDPRLQQLLAAAQADRFRFNALEREFLAATEVRRRELEVQLREAKLRLAQIYQEQGRQQLLAGSPFRALVYLSAACQEGGDGAALRFLLARACAWVDARQVLDEPPGWGQPAAPAAALPATIGAAAGSVTAFALSPDGRRAVTMTGDWVARVWDALSGELLHTLPSYYQYADYPEKGLIAFSPDGTRVVITSGDQKARLWEVSSGKLLGTLDGHSDAIVAVAFGPDGRRLATAGRDRTVRVWETGTGRLLCVLEGHAGVVNGVAFDSEGAHIVVTSDDATSQNWDVAVADAIVTVGDPDDGGISSAAFDPDGARIMTASANGAARLWDARSGAALLSLPSQGGKLTSAEFSPKGEFIVTANNYGVLRVWDASRLKVLRNIKAHGVGPCRAEFSPDGARIVSTNGSGPALVWDARSGALLLTLKDQADRMCHAAFSPDGARIVTASVDRTARIWDANSGEYLVTLSGHAGPVSSAAFSRDGARVVTGSEDRTARVWDAASGRLLALLEGHTRTLKSAAFDPVGERIVTASLDETARVWDAAGGQLLGVLHGHGDQVRSAVFNLDGTRVATASMDRSAKVWDVHVESRSPAEIATLVERAVPFKLERGRLFPGSPPDPQRFPRSATAEGRELSP